MAPHTANDYGYVDLPAGCHVEQAVLQFPVQIQDPGRYLVNSDLWAQLDKATRAGLILHEVIYRDAIERGQTNSRLARYMTALISSDEVTKLARNDYYSRVHRALFDTSLFDVGFGEKTQIRFYRWKRGTLGRTVLPEFGTRRPSAFRCGVTQLLGRTIRHESEQNR